MPEIHLDYSHQKEKWISCDWDHFLSFNSESTKLTSKDKELAFMLAAAALQQNNTIIFNQLLALAKQQLGAQELTHFLLAVYQVQLAKAQFVAGSVEHALAHFQQALQVGGTLLTPLFYSCLCEVAEDQLASGNVRDAIQSWQDIATILQEHTPEHVYHHMSHGYAVNTQGFGGTNEENHLFGDCHKHDVLEYFHHFLKPEFYFEIGVDEGLSLARSTGKALGVDARPKLITLPEQAKVLGMSSDAFFRNEAQYYFTTSPELAFIDGMHLFEFALRDFINFERYAGPYTLVVIDDIYPCHPVQAERRRRSGAWTGDVWKLLPVLQRYRPDLTVVPLRSFTTGLLLITGLDSGNTVLQQHYQDILEEFQPELPVPKEILERKHSLPSNHGYIDLLLNCLKTAKEQNADLANLRNQLDMIKPLLKQGIMQEDSISSLLPRHFTGNPDSTTITTQLFLPQPQAPYHTERDSIRQAMNKDNWQTLDFIFTQALPEQPIRFDPADRAAVLELAEVTLINETSNTIIFSAKNVSELGQLKVGGDAFILKNSARFLINAFSNDPIIFLPRLAAQPSSRWRLQITLRQITDTKDLREIWQQHSA